MLFDVGLRAALKAVAACSGSSESVIGPWCMMAT